MDAAAVQSCSFSGHSALGLEGYKFAGQIMKLE